MMLPALLAVLATASGPSQESAAAPAVTEAECLHDAPPARPASPDPVAPIAFERRTVDGGRSVIVASGRIGPGSAEVLTSAIRLGGPAEEIWFDQVVADDDAPTAEFARTLRETYMPVRLRPGQVCAGGCAQAFVGSRIRTVDDGAWLGFARGPAVDAAAPAGMSRDQVAAFWAERRADDYIRSGISRGLLRLQVAAAEPAICYLSRAALRRYNVSVELTTEQF